LCRRSDSRADAVAIDDEEREARGAGVPGLPLIALLLCSRGRRNLVTGASSIDGVVEA